MLVRTVRMLPAYSSFGLIALGPPFLFVGVEHSLNHEVEVGVAEGHDCEVPFTLWRPPNVIFDDITSQFDALDEFIIADISLVLDD